MFGICVQMAIYFLQIHTEKLHWANNYSIPNLLVNIYIVSLSIVFEIITKILIMVII